MLRRILSALGYGSTAARPVAKPVLPPSYFVFVINTPEGVKECVSLLSPEVAFLDGLHDEVIMGQCRRENPKERINPKNFAPNPKFTSILQQIIAENMADLLEIQQQARKQRDGYIFLIDARTATRDGHIPPCDIFGGMAVERGLIVRGSYEPNPNYQLFSERGIFLLPTELQQKLMQKLEI